MPQYELNVIVCTDPRRCAGVPVSGVSVPGNSVPGSPVPGISVAGSTALDLMDGLRQVIMEQGLAARVQVTGCRCIFGCTYGPRIDVARRWSGEKLLYGAVEGDAVISRRGRVRFHRVPDDLGRLILDNLPDPAHRPPLLNPRHNPRHSLEKHMMIRQLLEECQKGTEGVGFNEVVVMISNTASTAEVFMMLDDVRFTERGDVVTFMVRDGSEQDGTHLHLNLEQVREVQFIHQMNQQNLPSYSVWFKDENDQPLLRIYLRKSDRDETNQPRHNLFLGLMEKYGESVRVGG